MNITLRFDGGLSGQNGSGTAIPRFGWLVSDDEGAILIEGSARKEGLPPAECTNNVSEWLAIIHGLRAVIGAKTPVTILTIYGDSALIINQLSGRWKVKAPHLAKYRDEAVALLKGLNPCQVNIVWKPREENKAADALSRKG